MRGFRRQPVRLALAVAILIALAGCGGVGAIPRWELVLAASVIATLPMVLLFFLGQRYFVEGVATTGRKG